MATDVKFGLVVGLGVVIAVAVTYYPKGSAAPAGRAGSVMPTLPGAAPHTIPTNPARGGGSLRP
jgi:hypothetical protein